MPSIEDKYTAAVKLLSIMTELMIENTENPLELALEHRRRFNLATKDSPTIYKAGMEVAQELSQ